MRFLKEVYVAPYRALCMGIIVVCLAACGSPAAAPSRAQGDSAGDSLLGVVGYNYTSKSISNFTVNGQGGGHLFVSSPSRGSGNTTCCIRYMPGTQAPVVRVRWQSGSCIFRQSSGYGDRTHEERYLFYREAQIQVEKDIPENPKYIEIHFYPDDTVVARITKKESRPILKLDDERNDNSTAPRCPDDKKPAE